MADTSNGEIDRLQRLRTELENRLAALEEEQKTLEEETKTIRQKLAIRELEESVRKRQKELAGLRLEKQKLEDGLDGP